MKMAGIRTMALICVALVARGDAPFIPQGGTPQPAAAASQTEARVPKEQLDSLVAPIALYPDPMLAQVLAASTYPLEMVQLQQWLEKHKDLKDKALADAVQKENWDPSVGSMAALPDVVKRMAENIQWTSELGNAFLAQQSDLMDSVQRMRAKAKGAGNLKSNEQMKVETKVVESKQTIVIEQSNPQVVYVPSYNPTVVYGAAPPVYPYPPVTYPPPGYYAAGMAISFGVGVMMGAFFSGGWGYNCGWGGGGNNNVTINNNNNFNRNTNVNRQNVGNGNRSGTWQHNPQHRGGAPYGDRATANRFGGTARGDSLGTRQASARQTQATRGDRNLGADGDRNRGSNDRSAGTNRGANDRSAGTNRGASNDRSAGANRGASNDRNAGANRGAGNDRNAGANRGAGNDRNAGANRGTNPDQIGNRQVSGGGGSRDSGAFAGAGKTGGAEARDRSSRGASSVSGSGGGGGGRRSGGRRR